MKINNNISAVITNKHLLRQENSLTESMERLSSGLKINHASDSPAGMAISSRMQAQIDALDQASRNASDVESVLETADGGLEAITNMLQRIRELAVQAANDTNSQTEKDAIQGEIDNLKEEVNRIATTTEFNTKKLLDGSIDKRVYADNVTRVTVSDEVEDGSYRLTVNETAEQAAMTVDMSAITYATDPETGATVCNMTGSVSINGSMAYIKEGMTEDEVWAAINSAAELGGATLEDGWVFTSNAYGRNAVMIIETSFASSATTGNSNNVTTGTISSGGTLHANYGSDPEIELIVNQTSPESKFSSTSKVSYDGNKVTITDEGGFSLDFLMDEDMIVPKEIEFDVADIGPENMQVGTNEGQQLSVRIPGVTAKQLYLDEVNCSVVGGAERAIAQMDTAISYVSGVRSKVGAYMNRLEHTVKSLNQTEENMTAAISRITDTDMAKEMTEYTKYNVLVQAGTSALTQANELPQQALQLLG